MGTILLSFLASLIGIDGPTIRCFTAAVILRIFGYLAMGVIVSFIVGGFIPDTSQITTYPIVKDGKGEYVHITTNSINSYYTFLVEKPDGNQIYQGDSRTMDLVVDDALPSPVFKEVKHEPVGWKDASGLALLLKIFGLPLRYSNYIITGPTSSFIFK